MNAEGHLFPIGPQETRTFALSKGLEVAREVQLKGTDGAIDPETDP